MTISIRALLHQYAAALRKEWSHDRSKTVGASEIGSCARKTGFDKHGAPRDEDYVDSWGGALRGTIMENHYCAPGVATCVPAGWDFLNAGADQHTLSSGYLSATPDGMLVNDETGETIVVEFKSIDPRADISKEKAAHHFQVQAQLGMIRETTDYKPDYAILVYVNASFYDEITEFTIAFSPRIYAQAHARATQIMTAREAIALPPEGKIAGGDECNYCPWASRCADVIVAGVPKEARTDLGDEIAGALKEMRDAERDLAATRDAIEAEHAVAVENIKQFMRGQNTRAYRGDGWSISYSTVRGRETLDIPAIEAAGIDLSAFKKTGRPAERITIK